MDLHRKASFLDIAVALIIAFSASVASCVQHTTTHSNSALHLHAEVVIHLVITVGACTDYQW